MGFRKISLPKLYINMYTIPSHIQLIHSFIYKRLLSHPLKRLRLTFILIGLTFTLTRMPIRLFKLRILCHKDFIKYKMDQEMKRKRDICRALDLNNKKLEQDSCRSLCPHQRFHWQALPRWLLLFWLQVLCPSIFLLEELSSPSLFSKIMETSSISGKFI